MKQKENLTLHQVLPRALFRALLHFKVLLRSVGLSIGQYHAFYSSATSASKAAETKTNDILAMISPEGERVGLTKA